MQKARTRAAYDPASMTGSGGITLVVSAVSVGGMVFAGVDDGATGIEADEVGDGTVEGVVVGLTEGCVDAVGLGVTDGTGDGVPVEAEGRGDGPAQWSSFPSGLFPWLAQSAPCEGCGSGRHVSVFAP